MAKHYRKHRRAAARKSRRVVRRRAASRRCWTRRQAGGNPQQASLAQGRDYLSLHKGQYGGGAVSLAAAAPVGYTGVLDAGLRDIARVAPLDQANAQIQGMSDQSGGGRRRGRKGMANMKAITRRMRKLRVRLAKFMKKFTRRSQRGGAMASLAGAADYGSPGMLLTPAQEARAMLGMNPEWKLAADPAAFAPK